MISIIKPVLKIWINQRNRIRKFKKPTDESKLQFTIQKRDADLRYWVGVVRNKIGEENMQPFYDGQRENQKEKGVSNYKDWFEAINNQ